MTSTEDAEEATGARLNCRPGETRNHRLKSIRDEGRSQRLDIPDVTDGDLGSHHILLVGRPDSNAVAARFAKSFPLVFGPASFTLGDETYAHPATAVIAAGPNPLDRRYESVLFAGLSAEATWRCAREFGDRKTSPTEVWLWASGAKPRSLVITPPPPSPRSAED